MTKEKTTTEDARAEEGTDEDGRPRMADVEHTPPDGDGARAVWERGGEAAPDEEKEGADPDRVGTAHE